MHLLADLHLEQEHNTAQDDDSQRHIECPDLEGVDVRGGHVGGGGGADHASGDVHALHAWVETGPRVLIGADPTRTYARGLTLVQP